MLKIKRLPWLAPCEIEVPGLWVELPRRAESQKPPKQPRILPTLTLARQFQGLLDNGAARNRAALARRFTLTRARVTQIMKLLKLSPEVIAYIENYRPAVTERALRPMLTAPPDQQLRFVQARASTSSDS